MRTRVMKIVRRAWRGVKEQAASDIIKIILLFVKTKTITKTGEDGQEDGRCGLVKEKNDYGVTRSLIPMHVEKAEQKI
jgi:hypothetical protein